MNGSIVKKLTAVALVVAMTMGISGCGTKTETPKANKNQTFEAGTYAAEIDIAKDNTADMPSAEAVVSGGTTQEMSDKFKGDIAKAALTVNGEPVDAGIMEFALNNKAMAYSQSLMYMGLMEKPNDFDWNAKDPNYDGSYLDYVKFNSLEDIIPRYALIAEGKRRGITLTKEDKDEVQKWLKEQQGSYSDVAFNGILNQNGCPSIGAMVAYRELSVLEAKIVEDFRKNPEKYASREQLISADERDLVTVKHILVKFDSEKAEGADAKKRAEEVLAKVKAGEDFDKLIEEYNEDPGLTEDGYTFANDGTMVQEFADASFALQVGETSGLVETSYGYHIIKRLERALTITDYLVLLNKNAKVVINRDVFVPMKVSADIELYLNSLKQSMAK